MTKILLGLLLSFIPSFVLGQGSVLLAVEIVDDENVPLNPLQSTALGLPSTYNAKGKFFDFRATSLLGLDFSGSSVLFNITYNDEFTSYYVSSSAPNFTAFGQSFIRPAGKYDVNQASICSNFCFLDVGPNGGTFFVQNTFGVKDFVLIDADTDQPVLSGFRCGPNTCRRSTTSFNIRVDVFGPVSSVKIEVKGPSGFSTSKMELQAPYAAFGDSNGDYAGMPLAPGVYTITATPFMQQSGGNDVSGPPMIYSRRI